MLTTVLFAVAGQKLALHVGETTISFPFTPQQAHSISASLRSLLETFSAKQKAERPRRWDMMEYRYKGTPDVPHHSRSLCPGASVNLAHWDCDTGRVDPSDINVHQVQSVLP